MVGESARGGRRARCHSLSAPILRALLVAVPLSSAAPAVAELLGERLASCLACHGETGTSETPEVPSLGGQPAAFMLIQLYQFRERQRIAAPMNELTRDFTDDDLRLFSEAIAKLAPPRPPTDGAVPARLERGRAATQRHRCGGCHNPDMSGHDQIGRIGAQREDYLIKALREYKSGERRGYDPAMVEVARALSEEEITEIAHYLAYWR
jgi:cytochrome c553